MILSSGMCDLLGVLAFGYGTRGEVARVFCKRNRLEYPSGSFNRIWAHAQERGLVVTQNVNLFGQGLVQLVRLSGEGLDVCRKQGILVHVGEWAVLIDGHRGDELVRHTAMILVFAQQARARGYVVGLLPRTRYVWQPDLSVQRRADDPKIYVEVETKARFERVADGKWVRALEYCRRLDARLGIVMLRPAARDRLAEWAPGALVTDLQSLCRDGQERLWSGKGDGLSGQEKSNGR